MKSSIEIKKFKKSEFIPKLNPHIISLAVGGDKAAIKEILMAYEPYIAEKSTIKYTDSNGEVIETIDGDLAQSLRLALIEAIPDFRGEDNNSLR